ncbi:MAG: arginase family protein [Candidatus ainarchaeum sp.]|nr:arginase family protein [Candidatus ainarchaeum sp.]
MSSDSMLYLKKQNLIPYTNKNAKIGILGIPFDSTSIEVPGQRFGPRDIREQFSKLYGYDFETKQNIYEKIDDLGDIDAVHGSFELTAERIKDTIDHLDKKPIFLGGEHSITHAIVKCLKPDVLVIFDAHADLFDTYQGEKYSHISYLHKIMSEKLVKKAYVFGCRAYTQEELEFAKKFKVVLVNPKDVKKEVKKIKKQNIYLSVDLDVLEFNLAMGTGTPEFGGLSLNDLLSHIKTVLSNNKVVGADIVELNPLIDSQKTTTFCAAQILKEIILHM